MRREKRNAGLSVAVQNYKTLKGIDKSLFERFYLGYPYCLEKSGSFLVEREDLKRAVEEVKQEGKQVFLSTPPIIQTAEFELIEKAIDAGRENGLDGIEINDVGMFVAAKRWPDLKKTSGHFTNIYNPEVALEYVKEGAGTIIPNCELRSEELKEIAGAVNAQIEIAVYGNLALGFVYDCYFKTIDAGECKQQCVKPTFFTNKQFAMRNVGRANVTAEDFCLVQHTEELKGIGADFWRLETYFDDAQKINAIAKAFELNAQKDSDCADIEEIKSLARNGLCNGWFVGEPGHKYVEKTEAAV